MSIFAALAVPGDPATVAFEAISADPRDLETRANAWLAARAQGVYVAQVELAGAGDGINFRLSIVAGDIIAGEVVIDPPDTNYAVYMGDFNVNNALAPAATSRVYLWKGQTAAALVNNYAVDVLPNLDDKIWSLDVAGSSQGLVHMGVALTSN